ncbi:MAG: glycosyltransferase family 39 protein [Candidatus Accumulibacter sp.]|uniref:ArnT family glycosyltransferase n=1 Tax=Accumulibacter sp. TaxID=2053492 RepID=UPI001A4D4217|nr:glycosyltransferase family 39 protein [Accumulibacter sp.]MBL8390705.1 glycosyltransferase family 39 protein [Accumulibacter sp.]HRD87122.1 glycosyltransferase family 39 protein [Accumulibacter sp.]
MLGHAKPARFRGLTLPPGGWSLAALLALYVLPGLIGHDPWKNDDAVTIGVVHEMLSSGNWLTPGLAGRPYPDAPLYYWLAASTGYLSSWLLPLHDGVRLASGVCTLLALAFILLAARELHGRSEAPAAPLLLAGSIGFLFHAHEAQPMLATLAAHAAAYWGLTQLERRPGRGAVVFATSLGLGLLTNGLTAMLPLLPVAALVAWRAENRQRAVLLLAASLLLATLPAAAWLLALSIRDPAYLAAFSIAELSQLRGTAQPGPRLLRLLLMLPWYAWPAFPLAAWALWARRRHLRGTPLALPIFALLFALPTISLWLDARSASALLLLPPLVLLAVPGVSSLRRGAANAFDWFGMITFSILALLAWLGWCAIVFGWPASLGRQSLRLAPGFIAHFSLVGAGFALLATAAWCWLIATTARSPMRGIMHWMAGLTLFWLLVAALWMPWIDHIKTYRQPAASLARNLPTTYGCIASVNVADPVLASLDYFEGIRTLPAASPAARNCELRLTHGSPKDGGLTTESGWRKIWQGGRPTDRRESEKLQLYLRGSQRGSAPDS